MNNAVSTHYCQGPTIRTWITTHQNTQPEHWLQPFIINYVNECAQSLIPRRLKLPIYFKSREKSFLHPSWNKNTTLVRNQPNQKKLKTSTTKEDKSTEEHADESQPSLLPAAPEVDPNIPTLEDVDTPQKKFKFKSPASTVKPKHF